MSANKLLGLHLEFVKKMPPFPCIAQGDSALMNSHFCPSQQKCGHFSAKPSDIWVLLQKRSVEVWSGGKIFIQIDEA